MVQQYLDHSRKILTSPYSLFKSGSKEVPLISLFGHQNEYDLREGFPLLTTKKMAIGSVVHEALWFMSGDTNIKYLVDNKVPIWTRDAFNYNLEGMVKEEVFPAGLEKYSPDWQRALTEYEQRVREDVEFAQQWGNLGPVYGKQWRSWKSVDKDGKVVVVDQIGKVIETLVKKPTSKKIIFTAWNPGELPDMALEPCHIMSQLNSDGEVMDLQMYQRSCDQFLGVPFNIASYALITQVIAQQARLKPRRFIHTFGDAHFYCGTGDRGQWYGDNLAKLQEIVRSVRDPNDFLNILEDLSRVLPSETPGEEGYDHITAIIEQMSKTPKSLPKLEIADKPFDQLKRNDFKIAGYESDGPIVRKMAV